MPVLREVRDEDLDMLFEYRTDPDAIWMAADAHDPVSRAAFDDLWARLRAEPWAAPRTIELDGEVVGYIVSWEHFGQREVTYWIGREHWGKGIATRALAAFLELETTRPLYAAAAKDNLRAVRTLERFQFHVVQHGTNFSNARGVPVEEFLFALGPVE